VGVSAVSWVWASNRLINPIQFIEQSRVFNLINELNWGIHVGFCSTRRSFYLFSCRARSIKFSLDIVDLISKKVKVSNVWDDSLVLNVKLCCWLWSRESRLRHWLKRYLRIKNLSVYSIKVFNWFLWLNRYLEWSLGWTKPDVSAPIQPIGGVGHPTLFNRLGWVDEPVRRSNPTHSRGAHLLFEKKEGVK
jgi:hypothetical protein